uniref:glutamine--fructose-6-phosphate transaminase (isomerizing) n=1 Tax=viral metagenome TaxID=1070528 RepID=A0A6C0IWD8_9ZZZZ
MCGIIAGISDNIYEILLNGLRQLQNRGYDSAGICTINNNQFLNIKKASTENLNAIEFLNTKNPYNNDNIGIGHTRWATHGPKNDINSHPHISNNQKLAIVHNGIIENYKKLKSFLLEKNFKIISDTDTEIIINLIEYFNRNSSLKESIKKTTAMLEGTWGLVILSLEFPNKLYCTKNGSPLLVGYSENKCIVTSEQTGFNNLFNSYFILKNNDLCVINIDAENKINIITESIYILKKAIKSENNLCPKPYEHWMIKEIYDQINCVDNVLKYGSRLKKDKICLKGLDDNLNILKNIDNIILLGCGTSLNASEYSVTFFKQLCKFSSIQVIDGADFNKYDIPKNGKTILVLSSQSGETRDLYKCLNIAKENNLFTIGLINVVDSLIAREVDCGCYIHSGREISVASTKSFFALSILLILVALWFNQIHYKSDKLHIKNKIIDDLYNLRFDVEKTLSMHKSIKKYTNLFTHNSCFILGKLQGQSIAKEAALKIKEVSYIHAESYSVSSLKHGPLSLLQKNFPVIIICPNNHYKKCMNVYEEIKSREATILVITDNPKCESEHILIPFNKTFSDLLSIIPLQLLSYELALIKNINPDQPRNLAKVVTVE